jgi:tRNA pseudouridine38-40 synthase
MRIALVVEYDGSQYHGWQSQTGLRTVQHTLEKAVAQVADHDVSLVCAGRTDTGVHATHQVVHFDAQKERTMRAWVHGANSFLAKDVCVKWARPVPDEFHARYSALSRRYRYVIYNNPIRPGLLRCNVTWQYKPLNHEHMHKAAQSLLGEHDFTSFRSVECQSKTPMRCIHAIEVSRHADLVIMDITANAFLHHMVRNIAGVLIAVGSGRQDAGWVHEVLLARDRKLGAETAPSYGLYLTQVTYPDEFNIVEKTPGSLYLIGGGI